MIEGWGWPLRARLKHYFRNGVSLCGRWEFYGPVETGHSVCTDCKVCARMADALVVPATPQADFSFFWQIQH